MESISRILIIKTGAAKPAIADRWGDFEDWISFHPNSEDLRVNLLIDLTCSGNGTLYIELLQGGTVLDQWGELKCGDTNYPLSLYRDETYQFRLYSKYSRNLLYTNYTLEMRVAP